MFNTASPKEQPKTHLEQRERIMTVGTDDGTEQQQKKKQTCVVLLETTRSSERAVRKLIFCLSPLVKS